MYPYQFEDRVDYEGITLDSAVRIIAPLIVNTLLKRHPGLMIGLILADSAVQLRKCYKHKRKIGDLVLLSDYQ